MDNKEMKELNLNEMDKVSGGESAVIEHWNYREMLKEKYGDDYKTKCTEEELAKLTLLYNKARTERHEHQFEQPIAPF